MRANYLRALTEAVQKETSAIRPVVIGLFAPQRMSGPDTVLEQTSFEAPARTKDADRQRPLPAATAAPNQLAATDTASASQFLHVDTQVNSRVEAPLASWVEGPRTIGVPGSEWSQGDRITGNSASAAPPVISSTVPIAADARNVVGEQRLVQHVVEPTLPRRENAAVEHVELPQRSGRNDRPYQPVAEPERGPTPSPLRTLLPPAQPQVGPQRFLVGSPAPRDNGSDQIEIHIGRIEVTALPVAAPQTTPQRPRQQVAVNLSDYLSSHSGGGR